MNQSQPTQGRNVRLYDDGVVTVTPMWFISADGDRYRVVDLASVMEARGNVHSGVVVSLTTTAITAFTIIVMSLVSGSLVALMVGAPAVMVPAAVAAVCAYRWPPMCALRARYRGFDVELFRSRDEVLFKKVGRALIRARELNQEG